MKKITTILLLLFLSAILINIGCKKEKLTNTASTNTAPKADAGHDQFVESNEVVLRGSYEDAEDNIKEFSWAKISGPDSYTIENKKNIWTVVTGLEKGVYEFELTVTDKMDLYDKDTVMVTVYQLPQNPQDVIFKNLTWIFPWTPAIEVKNFHNSVAPGTSYKVYIHRDNDTDWTEVKPASPDGGNERYDYFVEDRPDGAGMYNFGSLYIFYDGSDVDDSPDVRISF